MARRKKVIKQTAKGENIQQIAGNLIVQAAEDIQLGFEDAVRLINEGNAKAAQVLLERLWKSHNDRMTPRQKANCRRLLGCSLNRQDMMEEAARCFLESMDHDAHWDRARAFAALGYLWLGNAPKARKLAEEVIAEYSQNEIAWTVVISTTPDDVQFDELEASVPEHLRKDSDVAMALATRAALQAKYDIAEKYIALTQQNSPGNPWVTEKLGNLMLGRANISELILHERKPSREEAAYLEKGIEFLTIALGGWRRESSMNGVVRVNLRRSLALQSLGRQQEAREDVRAAFEADPKNPDVAFRYAIALADKDLDAAIELLYGIVGPDTTPHVEHLLAQMLRSRKGNGDLEKACTLLKGRLKDLHHEPNAFRADYLVMLTELERQLSGLQAAMETLSKVPSDIINDKSRATLTANLLWQNGERDKAMALVKDGWESLDGNSDIEDRRRLANLLQTMGLHREALRLWKSIVRVDCVGLDTYKMIDCAKGCGAENELLELSVGLRQNGVWERNVFEYEICLREKYNDWRRCKEILQGCIHDPLAKKYLPYARAHLSHVAGVLGEIGLIETDLSQLPSPREVKPGIGRIIVQSLRLAGEPLKAVDFAYEVLRMHFDSQDAHLMMTSFMVPLGPTPLELESPKEVGPGTTVQYKEDAADAPVWHIIEDSMSEVPDVSRHEYSLDHAYSQRMLGLKKGDTFVLRGGEIQERKATILEVLSKYHYRITDCMHKFEDRFPDSQVVIRINAYRKDGQIDLDPIRRLADIGEKQGKELLRLYKEQPLPIYSLAAMRGRDLYTTLGCLISLPTSEVHCRLGHPSEVEAGARALEEIEEIVLDEMTLATLLFCDAAEHLARIPKKLIVSEGTLLNIENWEVTRVDANNPGMIAANVSGGLTFITTSKERIEAIQSKIRVLTGFIREHCAVESGVPLSFFESSQRDLFAKTLGEAYAETMALARTGPRVLWTDDLVSAAVFTQGLGGARVWSQLVFEYLARKGLIDATVVHGLTLSLTSFHYWFTSLNADTAVEAISRSNWDADSSPLREVLAHFGDARVTLDANLMLMISRLLKHCWSEDVLGLKASAVTMRVLNELAKRPEASILALMKALSIWVERVFGPDVLTARQIERVFGDWLTSRGGAIIIP